MLTWEGTAELETRDQLLGRKRGQKQLFSPVQLATSKIDTHTRLIDSLFSLSILLVFHWVNTLTSLISSVFSRVHLSISSLE